jgi:Reverse transcriptase (RNA-dependent DNA polymerase)
MNTVRIILSIAVNQSWTLYQIDVKNVFLQETLEEEVYMTLPPNHKKEGNPNLVCRLLKLIYGLKQSPSAWYGKLSSYLISCGFIISKTDHSLFCKINNYTTIIIHIYVDDIIIMGNNLEEIKNVKRKF